MISALQFYQHLTKVIQYLPEQDFWTAYDAQADVLCINFYQPTLPADDIILSYQGDDIIGLN